MPATRPSEGYFIAKREMNESLKLCIEKFALLAVKAHKDGEIRDKLFYVELVTELERFRAHTRNSMLWDTRRGE